MIAAKLRRGLHGLFALSMAYAAFAVFALNVDTADRRDETLALLKKSKPFVMGEMVKSKQEVRFI